MKPAQALKKQYYAYPDATQTRPVYQEEALLRDSDRQIAACRDPNRLLTLKADRAKIYRRFVAKVGRRFGVGKS